MSGDVDERFKREEARFRHAGYVIFFGLAALVFLPMAAGIITGLTRDRVWDPFTGAAVIGDADVDCKREAADLIFRAGAKEQSLQHWEERYRRWVVRCKDENHDVYDLLFLTRKRIQGGEVLPALNEDLNED